MTSFRPILPALALLALALPAEASTVPRVDVTEGQIIGAVGTMFPVRGAIDLSLDWARTDADSLGLAVMGVPLTGAPPGSYRVGEPGLWLLAARYTRRIDTTRDGLVWGATLAGGLAPVFADTTAAVQPAPNFLFVQPALVAAWNFGLFGFPSALRGTLGPVVSLGGVGGGTGSGAGGGSDLGIAAWLWPNAELAVAFWPKHEITLGGNGVIGWRGLF